MTLASVRPPPASLVGPKLPELIAERPRCELPGEAVLFFYFFTLSKENCGYTGAEVAFAAREALRTQPRPMPASTENLSLGGDIAPTSRGDRFPPLNPFHPVPGLARGLPIPTCIPTARQSRRLAAAPVTELVAPALARHCAPR